MRRARRVEFRAPTDPGLLVEGDRTRLELLMDNLLGNADKFSLPDLPIEVTLLAKGGEAIVIVLDRGTGLGDGSPDELFARFHRGAVARRVTGGMGLGLSAARRIVEAHGGHAWARPRDGGGSEVGFALPLMPDPGI